MADVENEQLVVVDVNDQQQVVDVDDQQQVANVDDQDGYAQLKSRVDELEKELHKKSMETDKALAELRTGLGTKRQSKA